jgi:hypothetical protein
MTNVESGRRAALASSPGEPKGHKLDRISWEGGYIAACVGLRGVTLEDDAMIKTLAERSWKATGASSPGEGG